MRELIRRFRDLPVHVRAAFVAELLNEMEAGEKERPTIEIYQRRGRTVCYDNGTPVDRKGWLYLPSMAGFSKHFQPPVDKNGTKIYRLIVKEKKLTVRTYDGYTHPVEGVDFMKL